MPDRDKENWLVGATPLIWVFAWDKNLLVSNFHKSKFFWAPNLPIPQILLLFNSSFPI